MSLEFTLDELDMIRTGIRMLSNSCRIPETRKKLFVIYNKTTELKKKLSKPKYSSMDQLVQDIRTGEK